MSLACADSAPSLMALCRLRETIFAIVAADLLGAVTCRGNLVALPRRHGAVAGVISYRGDAIALLDLRLWLPLGQTDSIDGNQAADLALMLQIGSRRIGVLVDKIEGLVRIGAKQIQRVHQQVNQEDIFHTVVMLEPSSANVESQVVGVLDVAALMRLSEVWSESGAQADALQTPAIVRTEELKQTVCAQKTIMALVAVDAQRLAISLDHIRSVEPMPAIKSVPASSLMRGYVQMQGRDVPIIDIGALLNMTLTSLCPYLMLLSHDDLWIGLPITAIDALRSVDMAQLKPQVEAGYPEQLLMQGVLQLPSYGAVLVPDVAGISRQYPLGGRHHEALPVLSASAANASVQDQAYIVVEAGATWALPMKNIDAVAFLDASVEWRDVSEGHLASTPVARIEHKQQTIALWDLRLLTGGVAQSRSARKVVICLWQGRLLGLLVEQLRQILPAHSCNILVLNSNKEGPVQLLQTKMPASGKSYRILNLSDYSLL